MRGIQGFTAAEINDLCEKVIAAVGELKGFADGLDRLGFPKSQKLFVDGGKRADESTIWIADLLNKLRTEKTTYDNDPAEYETKRLRRSKTVKPPSKPARKAKK